MKKRIKIKQRKWGTYQLTVSSCRYDPSCRDNKRRKTCELARRVVRAAGGSRSHSRTAQPRTLSRAIQGLSRCTSPGGPYKRGPGDNEPQKPDNLNE